ncbi:hypothetical protein [Qipengyuania sp.]|uniref:hypothetical protein n=1 Tax=Qipengyuania sp. TaxID=2004515 RepID=UPI0037364205
MASTFFLRSDDVPQTPAWHRRTIVVVALVAIIAAVRLPWFGNAVADYDEQLYSLIGAQMLDGRLPFIDLWDRKPFGLFAIFAFSHWALGPGAAAYQTIAALFVLAGALLVYALSRRLVDAASSLVAATLYILLLSAYGSYSAQSEVFHTPLMLLALWLLHAPGHRAAAPRALLAMLVMGAALQIKYTVLPQCLLLGAVALHSAYRRGAGIGTLAGLAGAYAVLGLLPTMLVAGFYLVHDGFEAFWFANFESFFARSGMTGEGRWLHLAYGSAPVWGLAALGFYAAMRLNPPRDPRLYALFCGWMLASLATVFLPSTVYLYYNAALAAPAALMAVPLIDRRARAGCMPAVLLIAGMVHIVDPASGWRTTARAETAMDDLAAAIAPHVDGQSRCLWIHDGPTVLYRLSGSCLPTRFIYPDHLNNALESGALGSSQGAEVARILRQRPPIIVTTADPVTPQNAEVEALLRTTLRSRYRPLIEREVLGRRTTAWRRTLP